MTWAVKERAGPYGPAFDACRTGPGPRPSGPYGELVGVFNTTRSKAQACADLFNTYGEAA